MAVLIDTDKCVACGSCKEVCPVGALEVEAFAVVDADACLECGACVGECGTGALSLP